MKSNIIKAAMGLTLSLAAFRASAQKTYTEGTITYTVKTQMGDVEQKVAFRGDSSCSTSQYGPAQVKLISNNKGTYFAVLVDVPVASIKKAAVLTPDEIDQTTAAAPKFTFTPTTETKQINGFNCKKVTAKDSKSGNTYDAWVTNDISTPSTMITKYFDGIGGFPIQFTAIQQGQAVNMELKSISGDKVPAGTFGIPAGYDRITLEELNSMRGGR